MKRALAWFKDGGDVDRAHKAPRLTGPGLANVTPLVAREIVGHLQPENATSLARAVAVPMRRQQAGTNGRTALVNAVRHYPHWEADPLYRAFRKVMFPLLKTKLAGGNNRNYDEFECVTIPEYVIDDNDRDGPLRMPNIEVCGSIGGPNVLDKDIHIHISGGVDSNNDFSRSGIDRQYILKPVADGMSFKLALKLRKRGNGAPPGHWNPHDSYRVVRWIERSGMFGALSNAWGDALVKDAHEAAMIRTNAANRATIHST